MVCNVAGWWTVHAGWWWWWCTQGGRVVVCAGVDARWWTRAGVSRLLCRQGWQETPGVAHRVRAYCSRPALLNGRSREQLDAAEEEDEFALFADLLNDAAINPQHEVSRGDHLHYGISWHP